MKKHFIQVLNYWLALSCCVGTLSGQSDILTQYIDQALANNLSLKSYAFSEARQLSRVDQAKLLWKPNVNLNASYLLAEGGRTILFPIGDLFNPVYGTLNELTSSQSFPVGLENNEIQLTPNNFLDASLTISKPLINSAIKHNILIQEALVSLSGIDKAIEEKEVKFQVQQAYFNYLKTLKGEEILTENIRLLQRVYDFNDKLIRNGKATPDIQSDIEYQITNLNDQVSATIEQRNITQHLFNTLLNRDVLATIEVDENFTNTVPTTTYDLSSITQKAIETRPELRRILVGQEVNSLNQQRVNSAKHPTLGVQGGIGVQTEDFSFDEGGPLYTAGLSLAWNIFDGGLRKKQLDELKIENEEFQLQHQLAEQQISLQVAQSFYSWRTKVSNLLAQEASIRSARTSYNATFKRYKNDRALLIEVITAQNRLINSELNKLIAIIDIHIAAALLEKTIFE